MSPLQGAERYYRNHVVSLTTEVVEGDPEHSRGGCLPDTITRARATYEQIIPDTRHPVVCSGWGLVGRNANIDEFTGERRRGSICCPEGII